MYDWLPKPCIIHLSNFLCTLVPFQQPLLQRIAYNHKPPSPFPQDCFPTLMEVSLNLLQSCRHSLRDSIEGHTIYPPSNSISEYYLNLPCVTDDVYGIRSDEVSVFCFV